jgi:hypothetical protein
MAGQLSMVQWLLGLSCNVDAADAQGHTALIAAAAHGRQHVISCLLDASCDTLATNSSLQSALHVAAATCSKALLPLLLPHRCAARQHLLPLPLRRPRAADVLCSGALLNAADINGHSPLLLALYSKVHRLMRSSPSYYSYYNSKLHRIFRAQDARPPTEEEDIAAAGALPIVCLRRLFQFIAPHAAHARAVELLLQAGAQVSGGAGDNGSADAVAIARGLKLYR